MKEHLKMVYQMVLVYIGGVKVHNDILVNLKKDVRMVLVSIEMLKMMMKYMQVSLKTVYIPA